MRDDVNARIEEWVKWSFVIDKNKPSDITTSEKDWLSVWKSRQLKKYEVTMNDEVRSIDAAERIDQGCNLELTDFIPVWSFAEMPLVLCPDQ